MNNNEFEECTKIKLIEFRFSAVEKKKKNEVRIKYNIK